jgi:phage terminase large subunit
MIKARDPVTPNPVTRPVTSVTKTVTPLHAIAGHSCPLCGRHVVARAAVRRKVEAPTPGVSVAASTPPKKIDAGAVELMRAFVEKYGNDPVAFAEDFMGFRLLDWQKKFLQAIARGERRISVRAGHGVGKSAVCAIAVVWSQTFRFPFKCVVTAPAAGQLFDVLYPEIKQRVAGLPAAVRDLVEVFSDRIVLKSAPDFSFISAKTSSIDRPEAMAGVHSEAGWVLLIFDEASGIPEAVYGAAAGSMSGHNAQTVLIGNPTRNSGTFFATHHQMKANWHTMHVSCIGNRLVTEDFINETRDRWGETSTEYRVKILGEFPLSEYESLISAELVDAAMSRASVTTAPPFANDRAMSPSRSSPKRAWT